jgi:GNAT acetyltransferase-like protein
VTVHVKAYSACQEREWNDFIHRSKNGTFLFDRGYMDYHSDRFIDFSLVVRDERERVVAVLPASRHENVLVSHGGLTYGGFVSESSMTTTRMLDVFDACLDHLVQAGIDRLVYKCVPHIYHTVPAEEDAYALFVRNAQLVRRDVSSAIDTRRLVPIRKGRNGVLRRARSAGLHIAQTDGFDAFWPLLERMLVERYAAKPVHTLEEIKRLTYRFADNIVLFTCADGLDLLAGSVVYVSPNVCHLQYNGVSDDGRRLGALDLVLATIIERFSSTHRWIDFGISTEQEGRFLNEGLIAYKEGFGARAVTYDTYELCVAS